MKNKSKNKKFFIRKKEVKKLKQKNKKVELKNERKIIKNFSIKNNTKN